MLFAQGNDPVSNGNRRYTKPYDVKVAPPVGLTEACALAQKYMGSSTNQFYCVSASCTQSLRSGLPGWAFSFFNTNGRFARIDVLFDKDLYVDPPSAELLHGK